MKGHHRYTGIRNAFQTIYLKEGGIPGTDPNPYRHDSICRVLVLYLQHVEDFRPQTTQRVLLFSVSSPSYPLDVARRRMQLGVVLPESDKCRTLTKTLELWPFSPMS
eukprot:XP_014010495.1 PREDICTED: graves disease carrier protein-like isoform X2 [Salmo salar]